MLARAPRRSVEKSMFFSLGADANCERGVGKTYAMRLFSRHSWHAALFYTNSRPNEEGRRRIASNEIGLLYLCEWRSHLVGRNRAAIAGSGRALAIVTCPGCDRKLRIPDGKRGTVTCTVCGAKWFYPETVELSDVEFRCSKSRARFNVISSRRSPRHQFVIQEIKKAGAAAGRSSGRGDSPSLSPLQLLEAAAASSLPPPASGHRGWLARVLGRKSDIMPSTPTVAVNPKGDRTAGAALSVVSHDAAEYNWSGFSCPYCGARSFVSCAGGHLACDGTAEDRDGRRFHRCFCGHTGFISGTLKKLSSTRFSGDTDCGSPKLLEAKRRQLESKPLKTALPRLTQRPPEKP